MRPNKLRAQRQPGGGGVLTLTDGGDAAKVVYTYKTTEGEPAPDDAIEHDGAEYRLVRTTGAQKDGTFVAPKQTFTHTETREVSIEENRNLYGVFPAVHPVAEDRDGYHYEGSIAIKDISSSEITESRTRQVDKAYTIEGGLASNDVTYIPKEREFETTSDSYVGATQTQMLQLAYAEPYIVRSDEYGVPVEWGANLVYRGVESYRQVVAYTATCVYEGEVSAAVEQYTLTAEYERVPDPVPEPEPQPEPFDIWRVLAPILAAIGTGGIGTILLIFFVRRKPRLMMLDVPADKTVEKLIVGKGPLTDMISLNTNITDRPQMYYISAPGYWAKRDQTLVVDSGGSRVYKGKWGGRIDLAVEVIGGEEEGGR